MKTHFAKLRQLTNWASLAGPFWFFIAFLLAARSWVAVALIPAILCFLLLSAFPVAAREEQSEGKFHRWIHDIGTSFFVLWIIKVPEVSAFLSRLDSGLPLWDWPLVIAVFIWCCGWSCSRLQEARAMKDHEFVAIFGEKSRKQRNDAECGADPPYQPQ